MGEDLRKKLMGEVLTVEWEVLRVHAERDRLFFVSTVLDLVEVGCALATNDQPQIAKWVDEARLRRPTAGEIEMDPQRSFEFLIVQPFVLVRDEARR